MTFGQSHRGPEGRAADGGQAAEGPTTVPDCQDPGGPGSHGRGRCTEHLGAPIASPWSCGDYGGILCASVSLS